MKNDVLGAVLVAASLCGCVVLPSASQEDPFGVGANITSVIPENSNNIKVILPGSEDRDEANRNVGNGAKAPDSILQCRGETKYHPVPAIPTFNYTEVRFDASTGIAAFAPEDWPATTEAKRNEKVNRLLPNIASDISVVETMSEISLGGLFSGKTRHFIITIDFMKYRTDPVFTGSQKIVPDFYSRIGAGLRVEFDVHTVEAALSLADFVGLAASVSGGKTVGTIKTAIIGMQSEEITLITPFTSDISDASIRRLVEALATIKAKMHEADAHIDPQFLARLECVPEKEDQSE